MKFVVCMFQYDRLNLFKKKCMLRSVVINSTCVINIFFAGGEQCRVFINIALYIYFVTIGCGLSRTSTICLFLVM